MGKTIGRATDTMWRCPETDREPAASMVDRIWQLTYNRSLRRGNQGFKR